MKRGSNKNGAGVDQVRPGESIERACVPKLCGADIELGNFVLGVNSQGGTGYFASRALLREIEGLPRVVSSGTLQCKCQNCRARRNFRNAECSAGSDNDETSSGMSGGGFDPQDWGRKFLPTNGGCAYIDLDHLELCLPEVISAFDHVACWHAMLRLARGALTSANEKLPRDKQIQVLVNNSDGRGNSYGSHLNFLVTRRAWNNIFSRKIHYLLYLASFQVSSIIFTGQGKIGSENDTDAVEFQISQRADFFETLMGAQTTRHRPLVNSRDESLCGHFSSSEEKELARLHVIFFDNTLAQVASLLKVGVMQIVLSMIEAESVNPDLVLDDPLEAVVSWSHDPTLQTRAQLTSGRELTAVELQLLFLEDAKRFVAQGGCDRVVPRAVEIMVLWEDTLLKLLAGDWPALAKRLDWVLKLSILEQVLEHRPELNWNAPQLKHLDHAYSGLDSEGLYWAYERSGFVERVVTEERIEHFTENPPEETRAWTRAMLLRALDPEVFDDVNWDSISFNLRTARGRTRKRRLEMANPLQFTKATTEHVFNEARSLNRLLDALGAPRKDESAYKMRRGNSRGEQRQTLMRLAD
ncbi:MAG: proteasome accessory factor PafA2 family protein [Acidobacteriota bacterium]|nr:proteasome accessory factor PafA2 family protein [Acidobacteriota bacterium]